MEIQDALRPTGMAKIPGFHEGNYVYMCHNQFMIFDCKAEKERQMRAWNYSNLLCNDWLPYYDKKEIRPENAGELWEKRERKDHVRYFMSAYYAAEQSEGLIFRGPNAGAYISELETAIHNQNGWTRLYPPCVP